MKKRKTSKEIIRELKAILAEKQTALERVCDECAQLQAKVNPYTLPVSGLLDILSDLPPTKDEITVSKQIDMTSITSALEYYANAENYILHGYPRKFMNVENDKGNRAKEALKVLNA